MDQLDPMWFNEVVGRLMRRYASRMRPIFWSLGVSDFRGFFDCFFPPVLKQVIPGYYEEFRFLVARCLSRYQLLFTSL